VTHGEVICQDLTTSGTASNGNGPPTQPRNGSFWFRVSAEKGVKVRQGPSRKSMAITSARGDVTFRFECGEFLRSSQVLTFTCTMATPPHTTPATNPMASTNGGNVHVPGASDDTTTTTTYQESYAKIYRRSHSSQPPSPTTTTSSSNNDAASIVAPATTAAAPLTLADICTSGEWVQVHGNGRHYLEECAQAPTMKRNFRGQGWRFEVVAAAGVTIRRGPSLLAQSAPPSSSHSSSSCTSPLLKQGSIVEVNERVTAHGDRVSWLRLKDGRGWIHDIDEHVSSDMGPVMVAREMMAASPPTAAAFDHSKNNSNNNGGVSNQENESHRTNTNTNNSSSMASSTNDFASTISMSQRRYIPKMFTKQVPHNLN
jgi:hypothetical protein